MEGIDIFCASDLTAGGRICPECWYSQALNQHALRNLSVGVICLFACSFLFLCICPILNKCVCVLPCVLFNGLHALRTHVDRGQGCVLL